MCVYVTVLMVVLGYVLCVSFESPSPPCRLMGSMVLGESQDMFLACIFTLLRNS